MDNLEKCNIIASLEAAIKTQQYTIENAMLLKAYLLALAQKLRETLE